jgi:hypothetical protein
MTAATAIRPTVPQTDAPFVGTTIPADLLPLTDAAGPGQAVLLTTDVTDAAGTLIYRILDRFVRRTDGALHHVANVGEGHAPVVVIQATRVWAA